MKYIIISLFLLTACNKVDIDPSTTILKQVITNGKIKKTNGEQMSVDGKEHWLENRAIELFEEMQRKNPHLSWKEIDELCYKYNSNEYISLT